MEKSVLGGRGELGPESLASAPHPLGHRGCSHRTERRISGNSEKNTPRSACGNRVHAPCRLSDMVLDFGAQWYARYRKHSAGGSERVHANPSTECTGVSVGKGPETGRVATTGPASRWRIGTYSCPIQKAL